jgi:hypothetical protein
MSDTVISAIDELRNLLWTQGLRPEQVVGVLFREAVEATNTQRCPKLEGAIERDWRAITQTGAYDALQTTARALLSEKLNDRLSLIVRIVRTSLSRSGVLEALDLTASEMLAGLVADACSVRCSFAGAAMPALWIAHASNSKRAMTKVQFEDQNPWLCELIRLAAIIVDADIDVVCRNPFHRNYEAQWEAELVMPPFGVDVGDRDELPRKVLDRIGVLERGRLQHEPIAIADALTGGSDARVVLLLSSGALFRAVGVEAVARAELLDSGRLAAIYDVPPGMVYSRTQITTSVLVLESAGTKQDFVRFIDLSNERFAQSTGRGERLEIRVNAPWIDALHEPIDEAATWGRDVGLNEIRSQNCVLTADRYLQSASGAALSKFLAAHEVRALSELVEIIRPRALPKSDDGGCVVLEASPGDIDETGFLQVPQRQAHLTQGTLRHARNQQVRFGDVLLSTKGTIGRVGLVSEDAPTVGAECFWTAGQSLVILRPHKVIAPEVIFEYLSNEVVQEHLKSLAGGAVIQSLSSADISSLQIPVLGRREQDRIVNAFRERQKAYDLIRQTREMIRAQRRSTWPHRDLIGTDA